MRPRLWKVVFAGSPSARQSSGPSSWRSSPSVSVSRPFRTHDELADERVGLGGHRDARARGQLHLDQLERALGAREDLAAHVAAGGVAPAGLLDGADEAAGGTFGAGEQGREGELERGGEPHQDGGARARLAALDLADHRLRDLGAAGQVGQRPAPGLALVAQPPRDPLARVVQHRRRSYTIVDMEIRAATPDDLPGLLAIYNDVIATSTAVYAFEPTTLEERRAWLESRAAPTLSGVGRGRRAARCAASPPSATSAPGPATRAPSSTACTCARTGAARGVGGALVEALLPLAARARQARDPRLHRRAERGVAAAPREARLRAGRALPRGRPQVRPLARRGVRRAPARARRHAAARGAGLGL